MIAWEGYLLGFVVVGIFGWLSDRIDKQSERIHRLECQLREASESAKNRAMLASLTEILDADDRAREEDAG